ncbi:hypothetical protein OF83DRAFT_1053778 [Amylostereum chailletii]|nr:hypothetical protein OF83DRAFT_1053778 [Amylostereum chailletii]
MTTGFQLTIAHHLNLSGRCSLPTYFTNNLSNTTLELPSDEDAVSAARKIMEETQTWKRGKSYHHNTVHTFSKPKGPGDGASWHARVSEHTPDDATFDEFWNKLGENHPINEKEYIKEVKKSTLLKQVSPTQAIWSMYYEFSTLGVSSRIFTVLQIAHLDQASPRTGLFISIPVDVSGEPELAKLEEKAIKGHYTSVEQIKELDNGKVEWRVATSSTPGGRIPTFLVESSMASQIAADVPHFLHWFHTVREKETAIAPVTDDARPSESNPTADPFAAFTTSSIPNADAATAKVVVPGSVGASAS